MDAFRRKPAAPAQPTPAEEEALARRLRPSIPEGETTKGAKVVNLRERMNEKMRNQVELRQDVDRILAAWEITMARIERPDEYLKELGNILENRHATPEVVREVVKACKNELVDFYKANAGSKTILAPKDAGAQIRVTTKNDFRLVPEGFRRHGLLNQMPPLSEQITQWAEHWIADHAPRQSAEATA